MIYIYIYPTPKNWEEGKDDKEKEVEEEEEKYFKNGLSKLSNPNLHLFIFIYQSNLYKLFSVFYGKQKRD